MPNSKDIILKVAFILFLEKGYKEVTIKNIMEVTQLSKGAIYHHFKSKEEIYEAALNRYYFELLNNNNADFITGNFKEDIKLLYSFVADVFDEIEQINPEKLSFPIRNFFSFQLESEINPIIREKIKETVVEYKAEVLGVVTHAQETGQIKSELDPKIIALQIVYLLEGAAIHNSTLENNVKQQLSLKYAAIFDTFFKMVCTD